MESMLPGILLAPPRADVCMATAQGEHCNAGSGDETQNLRIDDNLNNPLALSACAASQFSLARPSSLRDDRGGWVFSTISSAGNRSSRSGGRPNGVPFSGDTGDTHAHK